MIWMAFFICICSGIIYYIRNNYKIFTVSVFINLLWAVVIFINIINPLDWYSLSTYGQICVLMGIIGINLGMFSVTSKRMATNKKTIDETIHNKHYKLFFAVQICLLVLMVPMIIKAIMILVQNNFNAYILRDLYASGGEDGNYMSTFERLLYVHYVVNPCAMACIVFDAILCFKGHFWRKPLIYLMLLALGMTIISAARTSIFFSLFIVCIALVHHNRIFKNKKTKSERKLKYFLSKIFIVMIILLVITTILRSNHLENPIYYVLSTLVTYFGGGIRVFDQALQTPMGFGLDTYSWGICTFSGVIAIFGFFDTYFLGSIGLRFLPTAFSSSKLAQGYLYSNVNIGTKSSINAFPTMFYYFMRDGGPMFIVICSLIFIKILKHYEKKYTVNPNIKNSFMYFYLFYVAIMSVCWWEPMRTEFWMILIWGAILSRTVFKNRRNVIRKVK